MKNKLLIILPILLLTSCGGVPTSSQESSTSNSSQSSLTSDETSETSLSTSTPDETSLSTTIEKGNVLYTGSLNGLENNETAPIEFFSAGWMMIGGYVDTNQFKLSYKDGTGFLRTPQFDLGDVTNTKVEIKMHLTNFNNDKTGYSVGQQLKFSVTALDFANDEHNEVEVHTYEHIITNEDIRNGYLDLIPAYSSDFTSGLYTCEFTKPYNKIKISLLSKVNIAESSGCNLAINEIKVLEKE